MGEAESGNELLEFATDGEANVNFVTTEEGCRAVTPGEDFERKSGGTK